MTQEWALGLAQHAGTRNLAAEDEEDPQREDRDIGSARERTWIRLGIGGFGALRGNALGDEGVAGCVV